MIQGGTYRRLQNHVQYRQRVEANKISYAWDDLISSFTRHIIAGTSVAVLADQPLGTHAEPALRLMAIETRTERRALGHHFIEALDLSSKMEEDRFNRTVLPFDRSGSDIAYIFSVLRYDESYYSDKGGYDAYRRTRISLLRALCLSTLYEYKRIKHAIAIGLDKPSPSWRHQITSEDVVCVEQGEWDDEQINELLEIRRVVGIKSPRDLPTFSSSVQEYPRNAAVSTSSMSRQERRKFARQYAKSNRKNK